MGAEQSSEAPAAAAVVAPPPAAAVPNDSAVEPPPPAEVAAAPPPAAPPPAAPPPTPPPAPAPDPPAESPAAKPPPMGAISEDDAPTESQPRAEAPALSEEQIQNMGPEQVLSTLGTVTHENNATFAAACCKRVRVLCRDLELRQECDKWGASRILIAAYDAMPKEDKLVLQSLAAIVNLCSGDSHAPRTKAVDAGAIRAAAGAINDLGENSIEIGEMACLVVQNLCYGDDKDALLRRRRADNDGAIEAVIKMHQTHAEIRETCSSSLRLCVDRMEDLRQKARAAGAPEDCVKPISKEGGGGLLSFRNGFGTNRRKANKAKMQEQAVKKP